MTDIVTPIIRPVRLSTQQFTLNSANQFEIDVYRHLDYELQLPAGFSPTYDNRIGNALTNEFTITLLQGNALANTPVAGFDIRGNVRDASDPLIRNWALFNLLENATATTNHADISKQEIDFMNPTTQSGYLDSDYLDVLVEGEHDFASNLLFLTTRTDSDSTKLGGQLTYNFNPMVENLNIAQDNYLFIVEKYIFSVTDLELYYRITSSGDTDWSNFADVVTNPENYPDLNDTNFNTFGYTTTGNIGSVNLNVLSINTWTGIFDSDEFKALATGGNDKRQFFFVLSRIVPIDRRDEDFGDDGIDITFHQPSSNPVGDTEVAQEYLLETSVSGQYGKAGRFLGCIVFTKFNSSTFVDDLENAIELDVSIVNLRDDVTAPEAE